MAQDRQDRYVKWSVRKAVLERDRCCVYCGRPVAKIKDDSKGFPSEHWRAYDSDGKPFHFDHRVPFSKGGTSDESNIVLSCDRCNRKKGNRIPGKRYVQVGAPIQLVLFHEMRGGDTGVKDHI